MEHFQKSRETIGCLLKEFDERVQTTNDNNLLRLTVSEMFVYVDFLERIYERYLDIAEKLQDNHKKQQNLMKGKSGSWTATEAEIELFNEGRFLSTSLRLEIESFYLFAHILLTKATNLPQRYFEHIYLRGITCGSHERFWNSIKKSTHFNPLPIDLVNSIDFFTMRVVTYRDKIITHTLESEHHKRMLIKGYSFGEDGSFTLSSSVLYPDKETPEQSGTEKLEDLVLKIQEYFQQYITFILHHSDKSVITKNGQV